jgi:hypothetical protein
MAQAEKKLADEIIRIKLDELSKREQIGNAIFSATDTMFGALVDLAGKETALGKALFLFQQAAAIGQIIFKTAIANASAVAASPMTFGQPWVAINTITAGISIASVLAQSIASFTQSKGKKAGGYTDTAASDDKIVDFVHSNEFVANAKAKRNPTVKPYLDVINLAQENGTISTLNLPAVMGSGGLQSGGYSLASTSASSHPELGSGSLATTDPELIAAINNMTIAAGLLMKRGVQFPIVPFKKQLDDVTDLLNQTGMGGFKK